MSTFSDSMRVFRGWAELATAEKTGQPVRQFTNPAPAPVERPSAFTRHKLNPPAELPRTRRTRKTKADPEATAKALRVFAKGW